MDVCSDAVVITIHSLPALIVITLEAASSRQLRQNILCLIASTNRERNQRRIHSFIVVCKKTFKDEKEKTILIVLLV